MGGMNWTEAQLVAHYASQGKPVPSQASPAKPAKPVIRVELGDWVHETFFLSACIPSKKNQKRAIIKKGADGQPVPGLITARAAKELLTLLTDQCTHIWSRLHKWPLTNITLSLHFFVSHRRQDLDNILTATVDSLQAGGVIRTDSMKHLLRYKDVDFEMVKPGSEGVRVEVKGQLYIEKVVRAA